MIDGVKISGFHWLGGRPRRPPTPEPTRRPNASTAPTPPAPTPKPELLPIPFDRAVVVESRYERRFRLVYYRAYWFADGRSVLSGPSGAGFDADEAIQDLLRNVAAKEAATAIRPGREEK